MASWHIASCFDVDISRMSYLSVELLTSLHDTDQSNHNRCSGSDLRSLRELSMPPQS